MTNRITDILLRVIFAWISVVISVIHELHRTWTINRLKASTRFLVGCMLAWLCATVIPEGYAFFGMTKLQTTAITAFTVWMLWIEIIDFIKSKDIEFFLSLITKKK